MVLSRSLTPFWVAAAYNCTAASRNCSLRAGPDDVVSFRYIKSVELSNNRNRSTFGPCTRRNKSCSHRVKKSSKFGRKSLLLSAFLAVRLTNQFYMFYLFESMQVLRNLLVICPYDSFECCTTCGKPSFSAKT